MNRLPSRRGRLSGAAVAATIAALAAPLPAAAHSTLIATEPSRNAVVERSPDRVVLRFDERVETQLGSIRVFDAAGKRVDREQITRPEPKSVAVAIDSELARGTYTVAWRVISADSVRSMAHGSSTSRHPASSRPASPPRSWKAGTSPCRRSI